MGQGALDLEQGRLHLRREDVHAPDDEHVVGPPLDAPDATQRPAAGAGLRDERGHVPRPVPDHGHGLLRQGGEHELALGPVREHLAGGRVDDLGQEVVLEEVETGLGRALRTDARTDDLGEPVDVVGPDAGVGLDPLAHRLAPGFRAEDAHPHPDRGPGVLGVLDQVKEVGGGRADDGHAEVVHHHELPLVVAAGHGDHGGAERLAAVVGAETAGEEAVAVAVLDHVAPVDAAGDEGPDHDLLPDLDVLPGVGDDDGLPGRARGGVEADDLLHGAGEEAERVGVSQVGLHREGQLRQVLEVPDRGRGELSFLHAPAEEVDPIVGAGDDGAEPLQLDLLQPGSRQVVGDADGVEAAGRIVPGAHRPPAFSLPMRKAFRFTS